MKSSCFRLKSALFLFLILIIASCSVEKRIHNKGYAVQWKTFKNSNVTESKSENLANSEDVLKSQPEENNKRETLNTNTIKSFVKSKQKEETILQSRISKFNYNINPDSLICEDAIIKTNGDYLKVKIHDIEPGVIRFQKCDDNRSGYYYIRTSHIKKVVYQGEVITSFEDEPEKRKSYSVSDKKTTGHFDLLLIVSLIFSTLSVLTLLMPFSTLPLFLSIIAILTGVYSIQRILSSTEFKGLILAILSIVVSLYILVISLWLLNFI